MSEEATPYKAARLDPMAENKLTPEIMEAARKVETWAKMNGYDSWELMGICSRDHAWKAERYKSALEYIAKDVYCFSLEKATETARQALK